MWEYSGVWVCSFAWVTIVQESDCLEWRCWHGPICLMVHASRRADLRYNLGKVWGVLQATVEWGESPLWPSHKLRQGNKSVDEWYNVVQAQVNFTKYPPEKAKILHRDIFLVFPAWWGICVQSHQWWECRFRQVPSKQVQQPAKRMESSKATAFHIKQVAGNPQAVQINLLRHQCTELPAGNYKKKKSSVKPRQSNYKNHGNENSQVPSQHKKWFDVKNAHQNKDRCSRCGDSTHVEGFQCPAKKFVCKACHMFGHFTSLCYQKKQAPFKSRKPKVHQLQAGSVYAKESAICSQSEDDSSSKDSFCLQVKVKHTQANL